MFAILFDYQTNYFSSRGLMSLLLEDEVGRLLADATGAAEVGAEIIVPRTSGLLAGISLFIPILATRVCA